MINNKILIWLIILNFIFRAITAEEIGPKFPGKFNLEFKCQLDSDIIDGKPVLTKSGESAIYLKNELKGNIKLNTTAFYNINLFMKDQFDVRFNYDDATTDINKSLSSQVLNVIRPRNRFYTGLDNVFKIPDIMDIGINFEFRLANDLGKYSEGIEIRLSPILNINGNYDFGFSWNIITMFEFYLYPSQYADGKNNNLFQKFQFELYNFQIGYEFFHFFAPANVKCTLVGELYLLAAIYHPAYKNDYEKLNPGKYKMNCIEELIIYCGLNFDLWGIKPYIGFYCRFDQHEGSSSGNKMGIYTDFRPGFKTGISFSKKWFTLSIEYIGCILVYDSDTEKNTSDAKYNINYQTWENHISSYIKFKI